MAQENLPTEELLEMDEGTLVICEDTQEEEMMGI